MKKLASFLVAASMLALGGSAVADLCTIEATPAATLLLPYFEIPLSGNTQDVLFSINNASRASTLAHVTIWGDWSVEALNFMVYLTGFDVQTFSLGQILRNGNLPRTGPYQPCPPATSGPACSNRGAFSAAHPTLSPACTTMLTSGTVPAINLAHAQAILSGTRSPVTGTCGGFAHGDGKMRGYVTVDVMRDCTTLNPCDANYFNYSPTTGAPLGFAGYANILWGEWYSIDYVNNFAQGDTLVHLEAASPSDPLSIGLIDDGSFWNRCDYSSAPYLDLRESLGTTYGTQFYSQFGAPTEFIVWRDPQFAAPPFGYSSCGQLGFDILEAQVVFFDEAENPEVPVCPVSPCFDFIEFPLETQKVSLTDIGTSRTSGWMYANLNQQSGSGFSWIAQGWVQSVHSALGRFSAGLNAIQLDNYCDQSSIILGLSGTTNECRCNWFTGACYGCGPATSVPKNSNLVPLN